MQPAWKVRINGASGGVGTFAVQIAGTFGGGDRVCSARNVDMVRSLGADHVIDYTKEDFTRDGRLYDLILDNVSSRSFSDLRRALGPKGKIIPNSGFGGMGYVFKAFFLSAFVRQITCMHPASPNANDLAVLRELLESGSVMPVMEKTFPLDRTPDAFRYMEESHARGKIVITIIDEGNRE